MEIFLLTVKQMLMMASLILVGFLLQKRKLIPENSYIVIARLETYMLIPALNIITQLNNCTKDSFVENSRLLLYGLIAVMVAVVIAYPVSRLFVKDASEGDEAYRRNIYKYALTFGNFGFMGNYMVQQIWGDFELYKYSMFTFFLSIACNTWGLLVLIPREKGGLIRGLKKGLTAPPTLALIFGFICGISGLRQYFPAFVIGALENASRCMGPCAMILTGVVIGGYNVKELILNKRVYLVSLFRLILIPCLFISVLKLLGTSEDVIIFTLIAFATPLGMNTIVYPAAYGGETRTGASMAIISHALSLITIPLMYYIFVVLL